MEETIGRAVQTAASRARQTGRPVLASVVVPLADRLPGGAWAAAACEAPGSEPRVVMVAPDGGPALVGFGVAWQLTAEGPERFEAVRRDFSRLAVSAVRIAGDRAQDGEPGTGLVAAGAFRFDPERPVDPGWQGIPDAAFVVPRLLLTWVAPSGPVYLTVNVPVRPDTDVWTEVARASTEARALVRAMQVAHPIEPTWGGEGPEGQAPAAASRRWEADHVVPNGKDAEVRRWQARVGLAVQAIRQGSLDKVVLARSEEVRATGPFDLRQLVRALAGQCSSSARFLLSFGTARGQGWWVGASPEVLAACRAGTELRTVALAGSAPRGATPQEDAALGESLLANPKQQAEHRWVVEAVREALAPLAASLEVPESPRLLKLPYVQHLCTPITSRLRPGRSLLDVVAALHPTPAVGGHPREAALRWLREHEDLDRGWYAAPVGWWDAAGNGEFWVAIRSARLWVDDGGGPIRATLFAGCGIVADSDPHDEWVESALKLRAMRQLLAQAGLLGKAEKEEVGARRAAI